MSGDVLACVMDTTARKQLQDRALEEMMPIAHSLARAHQDNRKWMLERDELRGEMQLEIAKLMPRLYLMPFEDWCKYTTTCMVNRIHVLKRRAYGSHLRVERTASSVSDEQMDLLFERSATHERPFLLFDFLQELSPDARQVVMLALYPTEAMRTALDRYIAYKEARFENGTVDGIPVRVMADVTGFSLARTRRAYQDVRDALRLEDDDMTLTTTRNLGLNFGGELVTWQDVLRVLRRDNPGASSIEGSYARWNTLTELLPQAKFRKLDVTGGREELLPRFRKDDATRGIDPDPLGKMELGTVRKTLSAPAAEKEEKKPTNSKKDILRAAAERSIPKPSPDRVVPDKTELKADTKEEPEAKPDAVPGVGGVVKEVYPIQIQQMLDYVLDHLNEGSSLVITRLSADTCTVSVVNGVVAPAAAQAAPSKVKRYGEAWNKLVRSEEWFAFNSEMDALCEKDGMAAVIDLAKEEAGFGGVNGGEHINYVHARRVLLNHRGIDKWKAEYATRAARKQVTL